MTTGTSVAVKIVDSLQPSLSRAGITRTFVRIALASWAAAPITLLLLWKGQSLQVPGELYCNYLPDLGKKLKVSSWNVVLKMSHSGGTAFNLTSNLIIACYLVLAPEWTQLLKAFVLFLTHSTSPVHMSDLLGFIFVLPSQFPLLNRWEYIRHNILLKINVFRS